MKPNRSLLERAAAHVLEDAAYVFALPLERPVPQDWRGLGVRLSFAGPFHGHCELWAPPALTRLLASNMLGTDEGAGDLEIAVDALKESLNMICGVFLTETAGPDPVFHLGTPERLTKVEPLPQDGSAVEVWLEIDGYAVLARARIQTEQSQAA
jgi:hypothetical protein